MHPQCVLCVKQKEMAGQLIGMRSTCISQVLGTDMKKHFEILSRFQVISSQLHLPDQHSLDLPTYSSYIPGILSNLDSLKSEKAENLTDMLILTVSCRPYLYVCVAPLLFTPRSWLTVHVCLARNVHTDSRCLLHATLSVMSQCVCHAFGYIPCV